MEFKPRRSALYMPGSNPRALQKATGLPADVLILDLEDAVSPADKLTARGQIVEALAHHDYGYREVVVRVNALDSPWGAEDLAAFAGLPVDAILLPKVETPGQLRQASQSMEQLGYDSGTALWAMIETPTGVTHVEALCSASERLKVLVMGTSDLARELRVPHTPCRTGFLYALSRCVLAARCHGLDIIDGVHLDLHDDAGLEAVCTQGLQLGFDGKSLIHPAQVAAANRCFSPSAGQEAFARKVIAAWESASDKGVIVVDGKLIEHLHVEEARRTVMIAEAVSGRQ